MDSDYEKALALLISGEIIGMPTETVYGLAGRVDFPSAIAKIFKIKNRPFFDPLIVHVSSVAMAKGLTTTWTSMIDVLAHEFWPGPLTLVLPKSSFVSDLITAGLGTVGIRMPKHELALKLIRDLGAPLAAPSANKFGRSSPTTAKHVQSEFKADSVFVLDGGPCEVGLESTVLLVDGKDLSILRAGKVSKSEIEKVLTAAKIPFSFSEMENHKASPGHMKHHYMPAIPLLLIESPQISQLPLTDLKKIVSQKMNELPAEIQGVKIIKPQSVDNFVELSLSADPTLSARQFYSSLRDCAETKADVIIFYKKEFHSGENWEALFDRMRKAASLVL